MARLPIFDFDQFLYTFLDEISIFLAPLLWKLFYAFSMKVSQFPWWW
jgi:hypothetical protein